MKFTRTEREIIEIERACGDLRRGVPVVIIGENKHAIFAISPDNISLIKKIPENIQVDNKHLIISRTRAAYLFPGEKITEEIAIKIDNLSKDEIISLCSNVPYAVKLDFNNCATATEIEKSALKLAKTAELIPAIVTFAATGFSCNDFIAVTTDSIFSYMDNTHYSMAEACRTPLTLANAPEAEIIAYRPSVAGSEHYAIIIGKPGPEPLVRVHSSCYTGDLLASLDCDCRDQLQSAIELMSKANGGIILYLMQEGRGIGLVNKLRTYSLQDKGMDTVDANLALGFDDDERLFLPAAEILKKLGLKSISLLTNNPKKATGLAEHGIKVLACVPHIMKSNQHNKAYLQTKVERMGHTI
jgi:GTP cyclohydrolase II